MTDYSPFLIFSMPRSRSAWLSNFLSTGSVLCLHDGLRFSRDPPSIKSVFDAVAEGSPHKDPIIGNCDNGMCLFADEVMAEMPDAKYAVVMRKPGRVRVSLSKLLPDLDADVVDNIVDKSWEAMKDLAARGIGPVVDFDDLTEPKVGRYLWEHLIPDLDFPEARWALHQRYHVELHEPAYASDISPEFKNLVFNRLEE